MNANRTKTPSRKTVLVVDDQPAIRHLLQMMLDDKYDVQTAASIPEAVTSIQHSRPDMIFLDVVFPGQDLQGLDGLRIFRKINALIPVVVMTGAAPDGTFEKARELGADAFLMKPFRLQTLTMLAEACLHLEDYLADALVA